MLGVLFKAAHGNAGNAQHEQRKAEQPGPVAQGGAGAGVAEGAEHQLAEVIGGHKHGDLLHEMRQEHERYPESSAEAHGQIDHVGDAGCGTERKRKSAKSMQTLRKELRRRRLGRSCERIRRTSEENVTKGDSHQGEQAHDQHAEEHGGAAFREHVNQRWHGAGPLQIEPSGG